MAQNLIDTGRRIPLREFASFFYVYKGYALKFEDYSSKYLFQRNVCSFLAVLFKLFG